jgi:serine/threonine-protein kinase
MAEPAGRRVACYEVESELARGGMGVVHLAWQPALDRRVVLKALHRELDADPREERRFAREAAAVAAVHHPNVAGVYDCFRWRGRLYIAQEYVDGTDLASALSRVGPLAPRVATLVALGIARGLEEIHGRGLVHRDLKPANVLLGRGGEVKIADFGVALDPRGPALTRTGTSLGTPAYMSPEQIQGARLDFRSDVFSFGVLLYELVSGSLPFGEPAAEAEPLLARIEAGRFRPLRRAAPGTPRALARLVARCLRAAPKRRACDPSELRAALERQLGSPSPADARREVAEWCEARKTFPAARSRTLRAAPEPRPGAPGRLRRIALAAGLALLLAASGAAWLAVDRIDASLSALARLDAPGAGP